MIKALKVFGLDPVGATTDLIKEKVEGVLKPGPGLYRWDGQEPSGITRITSLEKDKTDDPWLVFIHGTASSTEGSFGGLWEGANARMVQLLARYPKRMLAFQHRTHLKNPMQMRWNLPSIFPRVPSSTGLPFPRGIGGGIALPQHDGGPIPLRSGRSGGVCPARAERGP
ncbi:MAG: hypothetical protein R3B74_17975 [Nitrospirales bacterium]|nr:hypothetical protein [Nitrospirales bacterium]